MYINLKSEQVNIEFNPHPFVEIFGDNRKYYYVELREYLKNDTNSKVVESYEVLNEYDSNGLDTFECFVEFHCDFEISIFKFIDGVGIKRIFTHRYCDYGEKVLFNLHSQDETDCNIWFGRIMEYKRRHDCLVSINSNFDYLNKLSDIPFEENETYYKTYNIGRFPKASTDFRSRDERMEGFIWLGNWKKFWSYQHPRFWGNLSSKEIVDDILGLD